MSGEQGSSVKAEEDRLADGIKEKVSLEEGEAGEVVDPWTVKTSSEKGIDYDKLISEFTHSAGE